MRIYAVGDIHGCIGALDRLLAAIAADETGGITSQLIFLGDYVDRGPDSCAVIERLLAVAAERPSTLFLKGNHEAAFVDFLMRPVENAAWLDWGGLETLESYRIDTARNAAPETLAAELSNRMPPAHLDFLKRLELFRILGDYFFVHAGIRPGVPIDAQTEDDMLWIRGEFHRAPPKLRPAQVIVHGHQPIARPLDAGWRINVDTRACFGGLLTAVVLDGDQRRFISV